MPIWPALGRGESGADEDAQEARDIREVDQTRARPRRCSTDGRTRPSPTSSGCPRRRRQPASSFAPPGRHESTSCGEQGDQVYAGKDGQSGRHPRLNGNHQRRTSSGWGAAHGADGSRSTAGETAHARKAQRTPEHERAPDEEQPREPEVVVVPAARGGREDAVKVGSAHDRKEEPDEQAHAGGDLGRG